MKPLLYIILGLILLTFIVIQFFQPEKNYSEPTSDDIFYQLKDIEEPIKEQLTNSCYDCHSNQTKYPFYARIAPVSWYIDNHISEGKEHLNFSDWGKYSKRERISALVDICDVLSEGSMPLKSYVKLHKTARLDEIQIEAICNWADAEATRILEGD